MNIDQLQRLIVHLYEMSMRSKYMSTLVWGEAGVGKTQTVKMASATLSERIGEPVITRSLLIGQLDVGDLIGLPREQKVYPDPILASQGGSSKLYPKSAIIAHMRNTYPEFAALSNQEAFLRIEKMVKEYAPHLDGETRTVYALPEWFPEPNTRGILFLDEINRSQLEVRQAMFQLLLERVMHNVALPEGWIVMAAANPPTDEYEVALDFEDKAFISRFLHVGLKPTSQEWLTYARGQDLASSIRSLIAGDPDLLGNTELVFPEAKPTPRSWELLSNMLTEPNLDEDLVLSVAQGLVGPSAASAWNVFRKKPVNPVEGHELLSGYGTYQVIEMADGPFVNFQGGRIQFLGQDYTREDGTEITVNKPTEVRKRVASFMATQESALLNQTKELLVEELQKRDKETPASQTHVLSEAEANAVLQFLRDLIEGGYTDLAFGLASKQIGDMTRIMDQIFDLPGAYQAITLLVSEGEIMSPEAIEAIDKSMEEDISFGGLVMDDGYDDTLLDRLLMPAYVAA
jgi:MoxR-like ATPase